MTKLSVCLPLLLSFSASAELKSLDDFEMDQVSGAGIGIVLEDFAFEAGRNIAGATDNQLDISGLETSSGQDVVLSVSQFYIAGSGSNQGDSVIGNGVNLGRLNNPFNIELLDGDDVGINQKAILELAAPKRANGNSLLNQQRLNRPSSDRCSTGIACQQRYQRVTGINLGSLSSRLSERADFGTRFDINIAGSRAQSLEAHATGVAIDGSYLRLWGDNNEMVGNLALKLYADDLTVFASNPDGTSRGQSVIFDNLVVEAELGYEDRQEVRFSVAGDGNFTLQIGDKTAAATCRLNTGNCNNRAGFSDFYNNGPRADIYIEKVQVGTSAAGNFGSTTISNLQVQYLKATSRDL